MDEGLESTHKSDEEEDGSGDSPVGDEQIASKKAAPTKKAATTKKTAPAKKAAPAKKTAAGKGSDVIEGVYSVQTDIDREWSMYDDHQSQIIIVKEGKEIMGSYDFGMFNGVMTISPGKKSSSTVDFRWRGVENGESEIAYDDRKQTGQLACSSDGSIKGYFCNL